MGDAAVYEFSSRQTQTVCCTCGVLFCMPESLIKNRREDGTTFYCPNGHTMTFGNAIKREADKLREELAAQARWLEASRADVVRQRERREAAERQAAAARGQVTKLKNRVGNGVCPCCNRTFTNLQRHMHTKHPGFANEGADVPGTTDAPPKEKT